MCPDFGPHCTLGPTGHYRGSPAVEDGSQRTYTPAEFAAQFGWKNEPEKATLLKVDE